MKTFVIFMLVCNIINILGRNILNSNDIKIYEIIANVVTSNLKTNGWNNILLVGEMEDVLFIRLKDLPFTFTVVDPDAGTFNKNTTSVPYHSNAIILKCKNVEHLIRTMKWLMHYPYWHPHSNFFLYYNNNYNKYSTAQLFYTLWYYKVINVIIIYRSRENMVSHYTPYTNGRSSLENSFHCWLKDTSIDSGFICQEHCLNVTKNVSAKDFGSCLSYVTHKIQNVDYESLKKLSLFKDKTKNMHGFVFKGYAVDVYPFFKTNLTVNDFSGRDGFIWKTIAELMNFTIYLETISKSDYATHIEQLKKYTQRKQGLFLLPQYQFNLGLEVDYTFPYVQSGVCFISHKPENKNILMGSSFLKDNYNIAIEFFFVFFFMWLVFFLHNSEEIGKFCYDEAGKDLINTFRMFYSIGVPKIPKRFSFLIFFVVSLWGLILNTFICQAFFFYMFSTTERGNNIDSFDDVYENIHDGKVIEGMASPDILIARIDPRIDKIYSKLDHKFDPLECVKLLKTDSNKICLIDCSVGHYLERSEMNEMAEQYLHVAREDRIHGLYLNMVLPKHSPMTENFNKHMLRLVESGIIELWMKRKNKVHESETIYKEISLSDLEGIFGILIIYTVINVTVFTLEVIFGRNKT